MPEIDWDSELGTWIFRFPRLLKSLKSPLHVWGLGTFYYRMDGFSTPQDDCFLQKDCEIVAAETQLIFATKRWGYFSLKNDGDLTTERLPEDRMETSRGPFFGVAERQYSGSSPHSILLLRWFEEHDSYRLGSSITTLSHLRFFCSFWQDGWRLCEEIDEPAPISSVIFH